MSDLDEELKATREIMAINKIIVPEEKTADEMLESLDYKKVLTPRYSKVIEFYKEDKEIIKNYILEM